MQKLGRNWIGCMFLKKERSPELSKYRKTASYKLFSEALFPGNIVKEHRGFA